MDQVQLPEWIDFEMEQQPDIDIGPLTSALKQRKQKTGGLGGAMGGAMTETPKMNMGGAKGGQSSL